MMMHCGALFAAVSDIAECVRLCCVQPLRTASCSSCFNPTSWMAGASQRSHTTILDIMMPRCDHRLSPVLLMCMPPPRLTCTPHSNTAQALAFNEALSLCPDDDLLRQGFWNARAMVLKAMDDRSGSCGIATGS